jgi:hypothetical protein
MKTSAINFFIMEEGVDDTDCWVLKGDGPCNGHGGQPTKHITITEIEIKDEEVVIHLENGVTDVVKDDMASHYLYYVLDHYFALVAKGIEDEEQLVAITTDGAKISRKSLQMILDAFKATGAPPLLHHK